MQLGRVELADDCKGVAWCYDDASQCLEADSPLTVFLSWSSDVPHRGSWAVVHHLAELVPREPQDDDPVRKRFCVSGQRDRRSLGRFDLYREFINRPRIEPGIGGDHQVEVEYVRSQGFADAADEVPVWRERSSREEFLQLVNDLIETMNELGHLGYVVGRMLDHHISIML